MIYTVVLNFNLQLKKKSFKKYSTAFNNCNMILVNLNDYNIFMDKVKIKNHLKFHLELIKSII